MPELPATKEEMNWVTEATILRGTVGSTAHGLELVGTDDHDEMGICIEPLEYLVGLNMPWAWTGFEQYTHRTAEERDPEFNPRRGKSPRSQAGDTDLVVYSLRKYARLAAAGNPTVLILLFCPDAEMGRWGAQLRAQREMFASREAGARFLGYLRAQRERLEGRRGQMRVTRTELVKKHGYDTKYAMHMVRLACQGWEYLNTGHLSLPMPEESRAVRKGEKPLREVIQFTEHLEQEICMRTYGQRTLPEWPAAQYDYSKGTSPLPSAPDFAKINEFLTQAYGQTWLASARNWVVMQP